MTTAARPGRPVWRRRGAAIGAGLVAAALVALVPAVREDVAAEPKGSADFAGTPVHVDADAEVRLDEERVRVAVGERPVVVGAYPGRLGLRQDVCRGVARDLPDVLVVAYVGTGFPALCAGDAFPAPDDPTLRASFLGSPTDVWLLRLSRTAELSTSLRVAQDERDRTVEVEELVLAFDVAVMEDYDDGVPRRPVVADRVDDSRTLGDALPLLLLLSVLLVLGALLLQALAVALAGRVAGRRRSLERRAALEAELARFSHQALLPRAAAGREPAAQAYLDAVAAFEAATDEAGLARAEAAFQHAVRLSVAAV